jgi:hypothetical protein
LVSSTPFVPLAEKPNLSGTFVGPEVLFVITTNRVTALNEILTGSDVLTGAIIDDVKKGCDDT